MWENIARRLEGSLVVLEPLEARHEESLLEIAQDSEIWRWMPYNAIETPESFHAWFEYAVAASVSGTQAAFAIREVHTHTLIGSTRYLTLRPEHRGLEIGWTWFSPSAWGTGANAETKLWMLEHAFEDLGCIRVEFKTDAYNGRSHAALLALPARFEGVFRKHMLVSGGRLRDSAYYSIIDDEWHGVRSNLRRRLEGH
jgi:RimJ/RimL family protein N-acetyltransferase